MVDSLIINTSITQGMINVLSKNEFSLLVR